RFDVVALGRALVVAGRSFTRRNLRPGLTRALINGLINGGVGCDAATLDRVARSRPSNRIIRRANQSHRHTNQSSPERLCRHAESLHHAPSYTTHADGKTPIRRAARFSPRAPRRTAEPATLRASTKPAHSSPYIGL